MKLIACLTSLAWCLMAATGADVIKAKEEDSIREAAFRYQFLHITPDQQRLKAKFYVLSYGEKAKGPSKQFLNKFKDNEPPIIEGALVFGNENGYFVKGTTDRCLVFEVTKIEWLSSTAVAVRGRLEETALRSSAHTYRLNNENGKWSVISVQ